MITYVEDNKMIYQDKIVSGLRAYNKSNTGEQASGMFCVYIIEKDKAIGAMITSFGWNWAEIEDCYYRDASILKGLINEVHKFYSEKVEAITYPTPIGPTTDLFKDYGYSIPGIIRNKPFGHEFTEMMNHQMAYTEDQCLYRVQTSTETIEYWQTLLEAEGFLKSGESSKTSKVELEFAALDKDEVIGGIYGYLEDDFLYVSILWVDEAYRKQDIGTKLMDMIEGVALENNIKNFWLGTASFQAKGFYEKRGYESAIHFTNCPKGFYNDTMVKYG